VLPLAMLWRFALMVVRSFRSCHALSNQFRLRTPPGGAAVSGSILEPVAFSKKAKLTTGDFQAPVAANAQRSQRAGKLPL
jgi:hypothetical protein